MITAHEYGSIITKAIENLHAEEPSATPSVTQSIVIPGRNLVVLRNQDGADVAAYRVDFSTAFRRRDLKTVHRQANIQDELQQVHSMDHQPVISMSTLEGLAQLEMESALAFADHTMGVSQGLHIRAGQLTGRWDAAVTFAGAQVCAALATLVLAERDLRLAKREGELETLRAQSVVAGGRQALN